MATLDEKQRRWIDKFLALGRRMSGDGASSLLFDAQNIPTSGPTPEVLPLERGINSAAPASNKQPNSKAKPFDFKKFVATPTAPDKGVPKWAKFKLLGEGHIQYDFDRPITKDQAAALIFQTGKLPSEATLTSGPGKNSWTLDGPGSIVNKMRANTQTIVRTVHPHEWPQSTDDMTIEWTGANHATTAGQDSRLMVKVDSSAANKLWLDFGRALTLEQVAKVIFFGGEVPDECTLTKGPGANGWMLQWTGSRRPKMRSPDSQTDSTWTFNPAKTVGQVTRFDLKNDLGYRIKKHYPLDIGQIPNMRLRKGLGLGEGAIGYEIEFDSAVTNDQAVKKLLEKKDLIYEGGDVRLIPKPKEPTKNWELQLYGIGGQEAVKKQGGQAAFMDAHLYGEHTLDPNLPKSVRMQVDGGTIPKDWQQLRKAFHDKYASAVPLDALPPDVAVWEQDGYIVYSRGVHTEATKLAPNDENGNNVLRYFMLLKGLRPHDAWREYMQHWDEINSLGMSAVAAMSGSPMHVTVPEIRTPKGGGMHVGTPDVHTTRAPSEHTLSTKVSRGTSEHISTGGGAGKPTAGGDAAHSTGGTTSKKPATVSGSQGEGGTSGKSSSGGSGEQGRTPVKADNAAKQAGDGDPGKAGGKRGGQPKTDKTTADERNAAKKTSNSKGTEKGGEGDRKSAGNKPSDGGKPKSGTPLDKPDKPATQGGVKSAPKSVLSEEKLAKVPERSKQVERSGENARELSETEKKLARKLGSMLDEVNNGKTTIQNAEDDFRKVPQLRLKDMEREYAGYKELTITSKDAAGGKASVMRLLYKYDANAGKVHSVKIVQMHPNE
jgi:hypothetical protein